MQTGDDSKTGEKAVNEAAGSELGADRLRSYLESHFQKPVQIDEIRQLTGDASGVEALKKFGYGRPFLVRCTVGGVQRGLVFHRIRRNAFGREREDDRVAAVWLDFRTFNRLPRHVLAEDMIVRTSAGELRSIGDAREMLLVTSYRPGTPYAQDLLRLRNDPATFRPDDLRRAELLAAYLAQIHGTKTQDEALWRRRLRDLVGHGEGIMGLTDSYEAPPAMMAEILREIEEKALRWRWRLKPMSSRLSQVHGDFHPFNIVFEEEDRFWVLDRSRGEWGEPADDVSCMSINYLFFSLQRFGRLESPFLDLHDAFWRHYLARAGDDALQEVTPPWFAWRALVLASPVWYPDIGVDLRMKILGFARTVLSLSRYDYQEVNRYVEGQ